VFWTINERSNVERQVERAICFDVARGITLPGELLPAPQVLSEQRLLNPHVVEAAFAELTEAGLLHIEQDGGHRIAGHAAELARKLLREWASTEVRAIAKMLCHAGLTADDVRAVFREADDV
jgi:DNA-binding transcriptional regulator YhcF (GntR family)